MKIQNMVRQYGNKIAVGAALLATATVSNATPVAATDDFYTFYNSVNGWSASGLGVGLAITALLIGAMVGIGKSSPMSALGGVVLAAFISWGPGLILQLITGGATI